MLEVVRPEFVRSFLNYLKHDHHLYNSIDKNWNNIPQSILRFDNSETEVSLSDFLVDLDKPLEIFIEQQSQKQKLEKEEGDSLLDQNRSAAVLISENQSASDTKEELTIAPGENKKAVSFPSDQYCEELAHPHLFLTVKFGY